MNAAEWIPGDILANTCHVRSEVARMPVSAGLETATRPIHNAFIDLMDARKNNHISNARNVHHLLEETEGIPHACGQRPEVVNAPAVKGPARPPGDNVP